MAAMLPDTDQPRIDAEHLKLLSIFHYVVCGLAALFACFPIFHLILGIIFVAAPGKLAQGGPPPPTFLGWFFIIFAVCFILAGWTFAVFVFVTGRFLARRSHHTFCFVMACVECLFMPFGTVLGAFTLLVLLRPSVKSLFTPAPSI